MVRKIRLPNNEIANFPDEMSDSEIESILQNQFGFTNRNREPLSSNVVRYGIKEPLAALGEFGHKLLDVPHNVASLISEKLAEKIPKGLGLVPEEYNYREGLGLPREKDLATNLIGFAPETIASLGIPGAPLGRLGALISKIPKAGKYLTPGLSHALSQGLFTTALSPEEDKLERGAETASIVGPLSTFSEAVKSGSPTLRTAGKLGSAALLGGLGYSAAKEATGNEAAADITAALLGLAGYKGGVASSKARNDLLKGVEGTDYLDALNAAKRLGLEYLTPAEASANPFVGASQGAIGRTEKGAQKLYEKGEKRLQSEEKSIQRLFDTIFEKEKLSPEVERLYSSSYQVAVPEDRLSDLSNNEIFKRAQMIINNKPAYKESLKNIPKNSIAYLDRIKQSIDDMIEKAPEKEARIMKQTRKELINTMDNISPEYEQARALAQREITRKELEDVFNKKPINGVNFYKYLENNKNFSSLLNKLKNVPEAQEQVRDMRLIFKNLINIPTVRTAAQLRRTSMTKDRSSFQTLMDVFKEALSNGKYDEAAVDLITDPNWANELDKLSKISKKEILLGKFIDLLGKSVASLATQY